MSLILPEHLPAIELLKDEFVDLSSDHSFSRPDSPLRVAVLNLMPLKIDTEVDLVRVLSHTPLSVELIFMSLATHSPKHTPEEHMKAFYHPFPELRDQHFDGLIITGAPVEHLDFEQVAYWPELTEIFDWSRTHVSATLYICWAAQAGLYHHYGIPKYPLPEKMFGIFPQQVLDASSPLLRGMDDIFNMPHSRHTEVRREDIDQVKELQIIASSDESGVGMVVARQGREVFVTGHSEYAPYTLDQEYHRDLGKGLPIRMPRHYYRQDDPQQGPQVSWRTHGVMWYSNWLHYLVNQKSFNPLNKIR